MDKLILTVIFRAFFVDFLHHQSKYPCTHGIPICKVLDSDIQIFENMLLLKKTTETSLL